MFRRLIGRLRSRIHRLTLIARGVSGAAGVRLHGRPRLFSSHRGSITLGQRVVLTSRHSANTLDARGPCILRTVDGGTIDVGDDVGMTAATISSMNSVTIGRRCLLGAGVVITDFDHHNFEVAHSERRFAGLPRPNRRDAVKIGDDAFIGARSIVLKGVTIGEGAVVGAGSVVTRDIPPLTIAAGNPCVVVGSMCR